MPQSLSIFILIQKMIYQSAFWIIINVLLYNTIVVWALLLTQHEMVKWYVIVRFFKHILQQDFYAVIPFCHWSDWKLMSACMDVACLPGNANLSSRVSFPISELSDPPNSHYRNTNAIRLVSMRLLFLNID